MTKIIFSILLVAATVAGGAEISPALKTLQGKWTGERINSEGRRNKAVLEIKNDKLEFRALDNDGGLRFLAKGTIKVSTAGDLRTLVINDIRAGRDQDGLEPVDDVRAYVYTVQDGKLYLASGFDKARDNERPRVDEYTKGQD